MLELGERWIEGTFFRRARVEGNDIGYGSICAAGPHATTLHWVGNDGAGPPGELLLLDAGVETHTLYTADVTRTLPVNGRFTDAAAQDLRRGVRRPGGRHRGGAARRTVPRLPRRREAVLAEGLVDLGLLPVSVEEALDPGAASTRRWTLHGTGHMLGLDVHDCAPGARPRRTSRARWSRAWCSPSSRACTSRPTT